MYAVTKIIKRFLEQPTQRRKVVINLGCGYDPVPFQWLSNEPEKSPNALFIDIDYPALMSRKCDIITNTEELSSLIQPIEKGPQPKPICLRSPHYVALGCDLADIQGLDQHLAGVVDLSKCLVLCVAEVSVTYMNKEAADALINWAGQHNDIRFCLLEQYLPNGEDHPFAQKMIQHFNNLQTPLKSIKHYPQLRDHERRFTNSGWRSAAARSLWDLWSDPSFVSVEQRLALNHIEPFDEWEEFSLFASHYFLLEASSDLRFKTPMLANELIVPGHLSMPGSREGVFPIHVMQPGTSSKPVEHRRFGAGFEIGPGEFGCHGGLGDQRRLNTTGAYAYSDDLSLEKLVPPVEIGSRMCHTITNLQGNDCLLVGGRASPDRGMSDCWLRQGQGWQRIEDLPSPLYRHCAVAVAHDETNDSVLIYGGRTSGSAMSGSWLLWHKSTGWLQLSVSGIMPKPRFGAAMLATGVNHGILFGGMATDGTIYQDCWQWKIIDIRTDPSVVVENFTRTMKSWGGNSDKLCRFGACLALSPLGLLLIGGITAKQLLPKEDDVVCLNNSDLNTGAWETLDCSPYLIVSKSCTQRPLLVGHSVISSRGRFAIAGGGAVCFSFGTYWNEACWTLVPANDPIEQVWTFVGEQTISLAAPSPSTQSSAYRKIIDSVPYMQLASARDFERVSNNAKPIIMKDLNLGACTTKWSMESLKGKIGEDRPVVVHEAAEQHMNFQTKNFRYCTKPFGDFVDQITAGSVQYLRSLANEKPSEQAANFALDFPELASDFQLPPQLEIVAQNTHSSPLRISGPVTMWLHYDVMANVLCQVNGHKRVLLFPPSDVSRFQVAPGQSSSPINVFECDLSRYPQCQEAILHAGDVLFIPPLWLHATAPLGTTSISVNVFFRSLKTGYATGRDVYGNRDLQAYEKGRLDIAKIARAFKGLPGPVSRFYLERLADELKDQALTFAS